MAVCYTVSTGSVNLTITDSFVTITARMPNNSNATVFTSMCDSDLESALHCAVVKLFNFNFDFKTRVILTSILAPYITCQNPPAPSK